MVVLSFMRSVAAQDQARNLQACTGIFEPKDPKFSDVIAGMAFHHFAYKSGGSVVSLNPSGMSAFLRDTSLNPSCPINDSDFNCQLLNAACTVGSSPTDASNILSFDGKTVSVNTDII